MSTIALKDIAREVGCSRSAVSYALRNSRMISAPLRERIQKTARELGWRPNAELAQRMALVRQTLVDGERPHLAIVVRKGKAELAKEYAPREQLMGALRHAEERGYYADVFNLADQPLKPARLGNIVEARGIQGIVFLGTLNPCLEDDYLALGESYACAVAGMRPMGTRYHAVLNDYHGAGHLGVRRLLAQGYRRIGAVLPRGVEEPLDFAYTGGLVSAFRQNATGEGLPVLLTGTAETRILDSEAWEVRNWFKQNEPDAILTTDPSNLSRILGDLEPSVRAPRIFSLDYTESQVCCGGVDLQQYHVGASAVDMVVSQLHRGESGVPDLRRTIQVEPRWKESPAGTDLGAGTRRDLISA